MRDKIDCALEPITLPGSIQPHGALLGLELAPRSRSLDVVIASRNAASMLGWDAALPILGASVADLLGHAFAALMLERLAAGALRPEAPWQSALTLAPRSLDHLPPLHSLDHASLLRSMDISVHQHDRLILIELFPTGPPGQQARTMLWQLQDVLVDLRDSDGDLEELALVAVRGIRAVTGYERVLIYRFDPDWNGEAIAEDKEPDWDLSLVGIRFPPDDIPAQARALYRRSATRWVADRDAAQVPLDADPNWLGDRDLAGAIDLSFAQLRSHSRVHQEIHRELSIDGAMSLSILSGGQLWGLVVCHHRQPHHPSTEQRSAASLVANAFALGISASETRNVERARRADLNRLSVLLAHMANASSVTAALTTGETTIASLLDAGGAAVLYENELALVGHTPPEADIRRLADWLRTDTGPGKLFHTNRLAGLLPDWARHAGVASGVLAVFLSDDRTDLLLWFRPDEPQLVSWETGVHLNAADQAARHARPPPAFIRWSDARQGFAVPWAPWQFEIAETLRHGITEVIVRALHRIRELSDRLRQAQKMEAVGQLTGGIAHDFNNLLAAIIGSLELLQARVAQGRIGEIDRYIDMATTSAERAASLIHRLLAFSRRQTLDPKQVDVGRLVLSMQELIAQTVGPAIEVEAVIADGLWSALCDANQLESALLNLAINARDAMPQGGRLTIEATNARVEEDPDCADPEVHAGYYVVASVTDTGTGMTQDVAGRVFEPFFTTKPLGEGTGLGLSMVYGFAIQSNGYTRVESEIGLGTSVRIYLPRHLGSAEPEATILPEFAPNHARAGETVLVVDDEPVLLILIGDALRERGFTVIQAANAADAMRVVVQSDQPIDLLVSDVGLPGGMNGRQLADAAREQRPELKVLFITGYAGDTLTGDGILEATMQVITKPFTLDVLAARVREMIQDQDEPAELPLR
ncbi:response regulator [Lichenicola sp.]|uniref:response regulator n=1 Tax=Lichenicola sp. TaxID=2804529 RepID=UPI003AFF6DF0